MKRNFAIIILLFCFHVAEAQTSPTRLRLKQLELAPDSTQHVITSDTNRVAVWTKTDSLLFGTITGPLTAGRIPRATGTYALSDGVLRDDGSLLAIGGVTVSGYSFYDYGTSSWRLPVGTTAQQPTGQSGAFRYNSTVGIPEYHNGTRWNYTAPAAGAFTSTRIPFANASGQLQDDNALVWDATNNRLGIGVTPANALSVYGGFLFERASDGVDLMFLNATNGSMAFGATSCGWSTATSATGTTDPTGSVLRFFPSTRYDDAGFTNVGFCYLGRTNAALTTNHIIMQIRDESSANPTSGTSTRTYLNILPQLNMSGSASLSANGILIDPTLTSYTDFKAINLSQNAATAIYQSGASATNNLAGNTIIGSTGTPARTLHVEGEARITDLTTDPMTQIVGADADGDLSASTPGFGLSVTGGVPQVDTSIIATQSDLSSVSVTTLYTGDGTIAEDRTVTIDDNYGLILTGSPGVLSFTETSGYIGSLSSYGFYKEIADTAYYLTEAAIKQPGGAGSTLFHVVAGRQDASTMATAEVNGDGGASLSSLNVSGESSLLLNGGSATYAADVSHITKIGATTIHTTTSTGIGINDTSPEKSLDVGGMGKFRQLSGQDNSVTIGTNANAGTGRSASITDAQSSDVAGRFSFTSGTGLTAGEWITLTWGTAFDNPPAVVLMPENANGASLVPYLYVVPSTSGCSIVVNVTGAPYESLTYEFNYIVIQGK
jgi:hypothetical protein